MLLVFSTIQSWHEKDAATEEALPHQMLYLRFPDQGVTT